MNVRKLQRMQKAMEYQYLCEDTKTRVYLSLVPSKKAMQKRYKAEVRAVQKALRLFFGSFSAAVVEILITAGTASLTYDMLSARMAVIRGREGMGGEIFFAAAAGIVMFKFSNKIFRNWR